MKRIIPSFLAAGILAIAINPLSAQVTFGGKLGVNYLIGSQKIQPEPKDAPTTPKGLGLLFGGYVGIPFSDIVGIRPEMAFSFRKGKSEQTINTKLNNDQQVTGGNGTFTGTRDYVMENDQRLTYFQVNVPLMLTPTEGLRIMVGPSINFLLGGKSNTDETYTFKGTLTQNGQQQTIDQQSFEASKKKGSSAIKDFKKADIMAMAGVGYTLPVGLDLDMRFYRGLSTTYDRTEGTSRQRIWTNLVEFAVGWTFGGGE